MILTLAVAALALLQPGRAQPLPARGDSVRVVLVIDDSAARRSLVRGAVLGAEEASHTAALFGTAVALRIMTRDEFDRMARASSLDGAGMSDASIYIVAGDASICSLVMLQSTRRTIPVLDVGCERSDSADAFVYSLVPRTARSAGPADSTRLELWHSTLDRFGAEQLNERFRRRFAGHMDSPAWAGWFALKIALDLALHAHATTGAALLRQLADPRSRFDGQKGRPLRFDPVDRRLVQPVYRVAGTGDGERVVAEVNP